MLDKSSSRQPTAVGYRRVSQDGARGETMHSPEVQSKRIREICEQQGWKLLGIADADINVSGSTMPEARPGMREALAMLQPGGWLVAIDHQRFERAYAVRNAIIDVAADRGCQVYSGDMGLMTNATAMDRLMGGQMSLQGAYHREKSAEDAARAVQEAIDDGIYPPKQAPLGYRRVDRRLVIEPAEAELVGRAFEMRAAGETIDAIRAMLADGGVRRSRHGVQAMLHTRVYRGETHHGKFVPNLSSHKSIVSERVFTAAEKSFTPRGKRSRSERLLARLGVLVCAECGSRMTVVSSRATYWSYRCPSPPDVCSTRPAIGAELIEGHIEAVRQQLTSGASGRAARLREAREAEAEARRLEAQLEDTVEEAVRQGVLGLAEQAIGELRAQAQKSREGAEELASAAGQLTVLVGRDDESLTPGERRSLIAATIGRVEVGPGRGLARVTVTDRSGNLLQQ